MLKIPKTIWLNLFFCVYSIAFAQGIFEVGLSRKVISPSPEMMRKSQIHLGGYSTHILANGVHDDLFARALFIRGNDNKEIMLIILDVVGLSNRLIQSIKNQVLQKIIIDPASIWVGATHTHSAPDTMGKWGGIPQFYKNFIVDQAAEAALEAYRERMDSYITLSRGEGKSTNRRWWKTVDSEFTVVNFIATSSQQSLGRLINFGAHPTLNAFYNQQISRDWVGHLIDFTEKELGGISIFANGILGDVSPKIDEISGFVAAKDFGHTLGIEVLKALKNQESVLEPELITQHFENWQKVTNYALKNSLLKGNIDYDFLKIGTDVFVKMPVNFLRLGKQLQGVTVPGEATTRQGIGIKSVMKAPYKLFLGLTEGSLGYFVRSDEWNSGRNFGYEETNSIDRKFGDDLRIFMMSLVEMDNLSF